MTADLTAILATDPARAGRELLSARGLPDTPLRSADGWSNSVILAPRHVVRFGAGRFRDAFAHEARVLAMLPDAVPHARVIDHGTIGAREWLILERMPGEPLDLAWSGMTVAERRSAIHQLGGILRALHRVPLPSGFANPWLEDALGDPGKPRDAYHLPPERTAWLLATLRQDPSLDGALLDEAETFIAARLDAFAGDERQPRVLVHADIHFANLLWDRDRLSALLDFEGSRPAVADLELDALMAFCRNPAAFRRGDADALSPDDLGAVPGWLAESYPELFSHPRLADRLAVYEALWHLVQLQHFGIRPGGPADQLRMVLRRNG